MAASINAQTCVPTSLLDDIYLRMYVRMDGWLVGWVDGWMDGWMDELSATGRKIKVLCTVFINIAQ